jgi:hypothetical protein
MNLRRTIQPYVGQTVIFTGVLCFSLYVSLRTSDWTMTLCVVFVVLPLFVFAYLYFGLKYRVLWDETGVYMRASGAAERQIPFDEITSIKYVVAASQSRPFRRIEIYGNKHDPKAFVDVSLRHFRLGDINQMMNAIRARRPDLKVPAVSANGRVEFPEQGRPGSLS